MRAIPYKCNKCGWYLGSGDKHSCQEINHLKENQIGGQHYKSFKVQPIDFIEANDLGFSVGCIIKYVCRYKHKNGIEDLEKAKDYIERLIEKEGKEI